MVDDPVSGRAPDPLGHNIRTVFILLGMTSIAVQIVLLREFITAFQGNELIISIVLASWMGLTALGAFAGRKHTLLSVRTTIFLLAVLPTATTFLLRYLRNLLFTTGSMISLGQASVTTLVFLTPFCLLSGYAFVATIAGTEEIDIRRRVSFGYGWESIGSVAGGFVFNILLTRFLDTFSTLAVLAAVDLCALWILLHPQGWSLARILTACLVTIAATVGAFHTLDRATHADLFPGQNVVYFKDTPYGNLTITKQRGQLNFFENNVLAFSTNDATTREESVHYAMAQRPGHEAVLIIGGGISGIISEVLKYNVDRIDYVEENPWILDIGRRFTNDLADPRVRAIPEDGRIFIRHTDRRYDAVLVNLPDPATLQLNRYYSLEFFQEVKDRLLPGGVFSLSLLPGTEYQGEKARRLQSVVYTTMRRVFPYILIVPGMRNYFLASDSSLDIHIGALIDTRKIATEYVNRFYVDDALLKDRSDALLAGIDTAAGTNSDFRPITYAQQLSYWMSYFGEDPGQWVAAGTALVLVLLFWRFRPLGSTVLSAGFAASSVEITLLAAFQVLYGSLFEMTGLLITTFMAGLALGALLTRRYVRQPGLGTILAVQVLLAASCVVLPGVLLLMGHTGPAPVPGHMIFLLIAFCMAALTAAVFSLAASMESGSETTIASSLYGLDLLGSAAGALLTGVYVIPALGILRTSVFAGIVSAAGAAICISGKR